jgi:hypothetical protein
MEVTSFDIPATSIRISQREPGRLGLWSGQPKQAWWSIPGQAAKFVKNTTKQCREYQKYGSLSNQGSQKPLTIYSIQILEKFTYLRKHVASMHQTLPFAESWRSICCGNINASFR